MVPELLVATVAAYLVGSLPVAHQVSRRRGVDIFNAGTGLAGAANVLRNVGKWSAATVMAGDMAKGVLAVFLCRFLGVEQPWILLPAVAAIAGHWNSVFSGFRGGDGLATLGGVALAMFPAHALVGMLVATAVSLGGQRMPYTSLLSGVFGYLALVAMGVSYDSDRMALMGIGALTAVVLAHAGLGHRRRRHGDEEAGIETEIEEPRLSP